MAALKFVRLLGLKIKTYSLQLDPQYSLAIMGRYWRQLLDRNAGVIDSTISLSFNGLACRLSCSRLARSSTGRRAGDEFARASGRDERP
jgi:hypothetical protein